LWKPVDPQGWLDPWTGSGALTSRLTVTPAVLILSAITYGVPYQITRWSWLVIQWGLLLCCYLLSLQMIKQNTRKEWLSLVFILFAISPIWRYHVEAGQIYIVYIFILLAALVLIKKEHLQLGGLVLGLLVVMRPTYILVMMALAFSRVRKIWLWCLVGVIVGLAVPVIMFGNTNIWTDYVKVMTAMGNLSISKYISRPWVVTDSYPTTIEGVNGLRKSWRFPSPDTSFKFLLSNININLGNYFVWLGVVVVGGVGWWINKTKRVGGTEKSFLLGLVLVLVSEIFIPAPRYLYTEIQWLPVVVLLLLIMPEIKRRQNDQRWPLVGILLVGFSWVVLLFPVLNWFWTMSLILSGINLVIRELKHGAVND
jgi:hypothetical protein